MTTAKDGARPTVETFDKVGFWALIATQFQGAFSDNAFKFLIIFYVPTLLVNQNFPVTALGTVLFNLPWLLFPAIAGALGDRFSKKRVTVWTKIWEVGVMVSGVVAVLLQSPILLFFTLYLMAMQSTFFSPAKYGILPEILPESKLSWGNGMLNMWTFLAVILGNFVAGILLDTFAERVHLFTLVMVGFSCIGLCTSLFVTPAPPASPQQRIPINPYKDLGRFLRMFLADRWLFLTLVGITYFWATGTLVMANVYELGKIMTDSNFARGGLVAIMALGIGLGSMIAGYSSREKIETGLIPLGMLGMAAMAALLVFPVGYSGTLALLFGLGFFGGFYDVPLAATLQQRSQDNVKGGMIATHNTATFSGMTVAAVLFYLMFNLLHLSPQMIFLATGVITVAASVYMYTIQPVMLLRSLLWFLDGTLVRLRVAGRANLPEKSGALMVGNHITFVDALALLASTDRDILFVMGKDVYSTPWMRWFARQMNILAIDPAAAADDLEAAAGQIRRAIAQGQVVCVNCEARVRRDALELPWYRGYGRLTEGMEAPIIPVFISRLWETFYVFRNGKIQWRWPGRFCAPIAVCYGEPLPPHTSAYQVREAVRALGTEWYLKRPYPYRLIHHGFIRTARRNLFRRAVADAVSGELTYFKALVGSIVFGRKLRRILDDEPMVGVLVPPAVGSMLSNVALTMMGRVPVNLNYTSSPETLAGCARRCSITHVLTSKRFLERMPIQVPGQTILLEEIRESVTLKDRLIGMFYALVMPVRCIERSLGAPRKNENDLATIIFSSGSEGEPKGVLLSHRNVMSQIITAAEVFPHDRHTSVVGFLPFFHSFGFTGTLWTPLVHGLHMVFHPTPLEPRIIGDLVQKYRCTIMIATSTFLQGFIRRCTSEQLASLKFVVCGAEKLTPRVRHAFQEKFGIEPVEGFGATECSPIVSVNFPDCESPGFHSNDLKHGTIGRPLPGQSVRVVDPDTFEPLPLGEAGLLLIRGANIMGGYLDDPERTAAVLRDGWYVTGDIAALDEDGFITITDRLSRFSKIGAEMVAHSKVEEVLHGLLGLTDQALAVAGVPDRVKGERLVVLHTLTEQQRDELIAKLDNSDLPNLWRPRATAFHRVEQIPVLATGKMDIRAVRKMALALDPEE